MLPQSETERLLEERLRDLGVRVERRGGAGHIQKQLRRRRSRAASRRWARGDRVGGLAARMRRRSQRSAPWPRRAFCWGDDEQRLDVGRRSHDGLSVSRHRSLGLLASGWRLRHLPNLPRPISGACGLSFLRHRASSRRRRWSRPRRSSTGGGRAGLVAFDPIWLAGFRINGRKVSNYRWGRVFLARRRCARP